MTPIAPLFAYRPEWRTVFTVSYAAWGLMEMWIMRRDRRPAQGERRDRGSLWVIVVMFWAGLGGAFLAAFWAPWGRFPLPPAPLFWTGVVLIWAGLLFRLWAVLTLGRFFRVTVFVQDDHKLVDTGPYRRLRNPSYTGAMTTIVGICLTLGSWLSLLIGLVLIGSGFVRRIVVEEAALKARFGPAWDTYAKTRWALVPFIW